MTDDYKEELLDYITGDLTIEQGNNEPILTEDNYRELSNHEKFVSNMMISNNYAESGDFGGDVPRAGFDLKGRIQPTNTDNMLLWGDMYNYRTGLRQSAIIISNEKDDYIGYVLRFSTGTEFTIFESLNIDENNLIYGVDIVNNKLRFLLLNDIISSYLTYGEYRCILRKSYLFPNNLSLSIYGMYKEFNSAKYAIVGLQGQKPSVITLDINVGEQNEWNSYVYNDTFYPTNYDGVCNWQNDVIQLKFVIDNDMEFCVFSFNGTALTLVGGKIISGGIKDFKMIDLNTTYIVNQIDNPPNSILKYYKYIDTSDTLSEIYSKTYSSIYKIETYKINNLIFILTNNTINIILNDIVYEYDVLTQLLSYSDMYVINKYNMYKVYYSGVYIPPGQIYVHPPKYIGTSTLDYNPNNYNGESYSNYNSLIAHKGTLYNNGDLIFSRNLYNKTILNNTTTSTLQIPNSMLNDTNIEGENLVSETNLTMVNNQNTITKNIYEMLLINFINTINVIDEDTSTNYPTTANYINENINIGTQSNYEDTQCTKYRINYTDTTTSINSLSWSSIDKFNKETSISIYVDKAMTSIDLISNDENTVYLIIPLEVEVGKYYTINQKVRTGDKPVPVQ